MKRVPNFSSLARAYRWMEVFTFGPLLNRCRNEFLPQMHGSRAALIYGDGDGRFTARLLQENAAVLIDAVDASQAMLLELMRRVGAFAGRVRIHQADAREWDPTSAPYDLVVTHFFLDCLSTSEVAALAQRLRSRITPSAQWIISDFATPNTAFGWLIARPIVTALYLAFALLTGVPRLSLPDHQTALTAAGFHLSISKTRLGGLLVSERWYPV
ncbi:MAG TPA: class I SAM-dependent methyltransferase [Terracidiphilus sp.]|jgi:hypothetical protein|nr:class I SAM-dependent methyltransferase [Terracidiphilus sp.]